MLRSGTPATVVGSEALLLPPLTSLPPETVAVLVTVEALGATSTVSVIAG
jgi:hypothetical protein